MEKNEFDISDDIVEEDIMEIEKSGKKSRKRLKSTTETEILCDSFDKVAEAIAASSRPIVLPPPPSRPGVTETWSCLNVIGCRLNKIPEKYQSEATQDVMNYSMVVLSKYSNTDDY